MSTVKSSEEGLLPRQRLLETIQELPEALVQELLQFTDYLRYREAQSLNSEPTQLSSLSEGASEGYRKMKASGFIGMGEAEADLSANYKNHLFEE